MNKGGNLYLKSTNGSSAWYNVGESYKFEGKYVSAFRYNGDTYTIYRHVANPLAYAKSLIEEARSVTSTRSLFNALAALAPAIANKERNTSKAGQWKFGMNEAGLVIGSAAVLADFLQWMKDNKKMEGYYNSVGNLIFTNLVEWESGYFQRG